MSLDAAIVDFSAALLLRYFRRGALTAGGTPRLDGQRDLDMLKGHWAVSEPVRALVGYVLTHAHETQSLLAFRTRIDDAVARGRIDARRTWHYRLQSGLASAIVSEEPVRCFNTGPNLVLAWVLKEAAAYTAQLSSWQGPASPYVTVIEDAQGKMRSIRRLEPLREPLRSVRLGHRPGAGALRAAARARQKIYNLAVEAYALLQGLERGVPLAMETIARTALIAPLEDWRRFELAVGLAAGEALAAAIEAPLQLHLLGGDSAAPIATAGRFAIYWQQRSSYYTPPAPEPSEWITQIALDAYGFSPGADRPDLVVVDRAQGRVAAIIEVKYVSGDSTAGRFREAVGQLVRYARGYAPAGEVEPLLACSLVALSHGAPGRISADSPAPHSVDFAGLAGNELGSWARRVAG